MKSTTQKLNEIKQYGYPLDFGQALEQSFSNYKKIALLSGAVILVLAIIFYALMIGVFITFYGISSLTDFTEFQTQGTTITMLIGNMLLGIIMAVIIAPLSAGVLQMAHNAETYREFSFSTAFMHYKSSYIKDILLATLIVALTTNVFSFAMELSFPMIGEDGMSNPGNGWAKFIVVVVSLFASFLTFLTVPLIIFGNLKAVDAIKGSITLVSRRFFIILGLLIVGIVAAFIGVIGCCVGIFFTLPIIYSMQYVIYRTAVGIDEHDELDDVGFNSDL